MEKNKSKRGGKRPNAGAKTKADAKLSSGLRIHPALKKRLFDAARVWGISQNQIAESALRAYLDHLEKLDKHEEINDEN